MDEEDWWLGDHYVIPLTSSDETIAVVDEYNRGSTAPSEYYDYTRIRLIGTGEVTITFDQGTIQNYEDNGYKVYGGDSSVTFTVHEPRTYPSDDDLTYELTEDTDSGESYYKVVAVVHDTTVIEIPAEIGGVSVKEIADGVFLDHLVLQEILEDEESEYFSSVDGVLYPGGYAYL